MRIEAKSLTFKYENFFTINFYPIHNNRKFDQLHIISVGVSVTISLNRISNNAQSNLLEKSKQYYVSIVRVNVLFMFGLLRLHRHALLKMTSSSGMPQRQNTYTIVRIPSSNDDYTMRFYCTVFLRTKL